MIKMVNILQEIKLSNDNKIVVKTTNIEDHNGYIQFTFYIDEQKYIGTYSYEMPDYSVGLVCVIRDSIEKTILENFLEDNNIEFEVDQVDDGLDFYLIDKKFFDLGKYNMNEIKLSNDDLIRFEIIKTDNELLEIRLSGNTSKIPVEVRYNSFKTDYINYIIRDEEIDEFSGSTIDGVDYVSFSFYIRSSEIPPYLKEFYQYLKNKNIKFEIEINNNDLDIHINKDNFVEIKNDLNNDLDEIKLSGDNSRGNLIKLYKPMKENLINDDEFNEEDYEEVDSLKALSNLSEPESFNDLDVETNSIYDYTSKVAMIAPEGITAPEVLDTIENIDEVPWSTVLKLLIFLADNNLLKATTSDDLLSSKDVIRKYGTGGTQRALSFSPMSLNEKNPCWKGYKQIGTKEKNGKTVPNCVPIEEEIDICEDKLEEFLYELASLRKLPLLISEAKYQGRTVPLNKPMRGDSKKFKVYVKNEKGNVVKVNFGAKGMNIKKNNPKRRKAFRSRHNCDNPGPKWKARYWSCKKW